MSNAAPRVPGRGSRDALAADVSSRLRAGRSIVLEGEAGLGKTTLLRQAADVLRSERAVVTAITSAAARRIPFAAFAHVLDDTRGAPADRLSQAIHQLAAPSGSPIVMVDDAQHLDDESAVLIQQLVAADVVVALAVRSLATAPDTVERLVRDGDVDRVALPPLSLGEVTAIAEGSLGGLLDARSSELLHRASEGNPLRARELIEASRHEGRLTCAEGVWALNSLAMGATSTELIAERANRWTEPVRRAAEIVAAGHAVPEVVLRSWADKAVLDQAFAEHVLQRRAIDDAIELTHPLVGEVLRAAMGPDLVRLRLQELTSAAESSGDAVDMSLVAQWLIDLGGQGAVAVETLIAASDRMIDQVRPHLARKLAEAAVRIDPAAAMPAYLRAQAQSGHAVVSDEAGEPDELVAVARGQAESFTLGLVPLAGVREALTAAAIALPPGPIHAELRVLDLVTALMSGGPLGPLTDELLAMEQRTRGHLPSLIAAAAAGTALNEAGRYDDTIALYGAIAADGPIDSVYHRLQFALSEFEALLRSGRPTAARAVLDERLRRTPGADAPIAVVYRAAAEAQLWLAEGQPAVAARHVGQILGVLGDLDSAGIRTWAVATLRWARAWMGLADPEVTPAGAALRPSDQGLLVYPSARLAAVSSEAERGALLSAREQALALATESAGDGHWGVALDALHLAARIRATSGIVISVEQAADHTQGELSRVIADHVAVLARPNTAAFEKVALGFLEMGHPALANEAFHQAAATASDEGRRSSALRLRETAAALMTSGRRPTFAARRGTSVAGVEQLTAREREIAVAVSSGATNAEVAASLAISRRTVEAHLQAIYRKTGVSDRETLAALLSTS